MTARQQTLDLPKDAAGQSLASPPGCALSVLVGDCPAGGVVLDPFGGSGTTGQVALELGRKATLIELNPDYAKIIDQRTAITPGLALD